MPDRGHALFDTALGGCGVAWGAQGRLALQLPEADAATVRARRLPRAPGAVETPPSALAQPAIDGVTALLRGERVDLSPLELDLCGVPTLHARIYDIARRIPCGRTLSCGQAAEQPGERQLAQTVDRRWHATPSRQWCRAAACSAPTASPAASRRAAGCAPSCNCC